MGVKRWIPVKCRDNFMNLFCYKKKLITESKFGTLSILQNKPQVLWVASSMRYTYTYSPAPKKR